MITKQTNQRPLRGLLGDLSVDLRLLWTQTVHLAQAELRAAVSGLAISAAGLAAGALVVFVGFLVLIAAVVLGAIALGLPPWAAAAIVGLVIAVAGGVTIQMCLTRLKGLHLDLRDTRESVAETITWLKTQVVK